MFEENKISILQSILVGISALLPLIFLVIVNDDIMSVDFPILVGLSIQAFIGFASFMLVLSYEPKEKIK